jgi:SAM-dependent methyltransferase
MGMEHRIAGSATRKRNASADDWVRETAFGRWFLGTDIWRKYVLSDALDKLQRISPGQPAVGAHILDVGCGQGTALPLLDAAFAPRRITGIDIDADLIEIGRRKLEEDTAAKLFLQQGSATNIALADDSVDMVLCHQVLHHIVQQRDALAEMHRVLRPGGLLLLAESCQCFIESSWVRALFRHPREAQRAAAGYLELVREAGFQIGHEAILTESPWWSRADLGVGQRLGITPAEGEGLEPSEVLCVAVKAP